MAMDFIDARKYYEQREEILDFITKNEDNYSISVARYLRFMITTNSVVSYNGPLATCLLQLLSKYDVIKNEKDFYKVFAETLKKYNLLNGNCCEVAAGEYPRLSEIIYPTVEEKHSNLTIYEPTLTIKKLGNAKLVKEKFTFETDISGYDTLFGMFPCEATIPLIEKSITADKNLLVAFCDCDHSTEKYPFKSGKTWADDVCANLKKEYGDELQILQWPEEIQQPTPILLRMTEEHKRMHLKK